MPQEVAQATAEIRYTMVVVYPTMRARDEWLRYSLRSLENVIGEVEVLLIGHKPAWAKNVGYIPFADSNERYKNTFNKLVMASTVSQEFLWMNDDFFIIRPTTIEALKQPYYLEDFKEIKRWGGKWYQRQLREQYKILMRSGLQTINYATHTPKFYNSKKAGEVIAFFGLTERCPAFFENFYYNYIGAHGQAKPVKDVKYGKYDNSQFDKHKVDGKLFFNFDKTGADSGAFEYVKSVFKEKSRYEE